MFGSKSRAEKLKEQAEGTSLIPMAALAAAYAGAKPVAERLLYDDDLRDNLRVFITSARTILDELSDEDPAEIVGRLWDDDKLRKQVEAAAGAAQEGTKRVRGQKVRQGGGGRKLLFLLLLAAVGFLFLNPKTGPQARNFVQQAYGSITSGD
ncbi:MAG: hypothetical protein M3533_03470 [Actinomycetota bacterium]|nr:hypothetical protein [Actinomycetota bacterium]MDQ3375940.1 hypothetical protein [Actinomycetota bacterium]